MTGGWTCPIDYRGVVNVEKGSSIIRYKLAELIQKFLRWGTPLSRRPQLHFKHDYGGESKPALQQPRFKHDSDELVRYTTREAVILEKGSVIIRYKLPELIKNAS